jgi:hypothetical protein
MDARIGPPGTGNLHRLVKQPGDRALELARDRPG